MSKRIVPVEVFTCVMCRRVSYVADFLPEPEVEISTVTVTDGTTPLRSLTLCEEDLAPFKALFALAAEQGLPPEVEDQRALPKQSRRKGGDCEYCGKKGYENLQQHWVAVHPDKADERCTRINSDGAVCGYPFFTERSKNRHLKVTHEIEVKS